MLKDLRKKKLKLFVPLIVLFSLGFVEVFVYMTYLLVKPNTYENAEVLDLYAENDPGELSGKYYTVKVDNLVGYFEEETIVNKKTDKETVSSRKYCMIVNGENNTSFLMAVEIPSSMIDTAEEIVENTENILTDTTGEYQSSGAYLTLTGKIAYMDSETEEHWKEALEDVGIDSDDNEIVTSLLLTPGNNSDDDPIAFMIILVLIGAVLIFLVVKLNNDKFQKQIKKVISSSPDPAQTERELNELYFGTKKDGFGFRMSDRWLIYQKGSGSFVIPADSITWVYANCTSIKAYRVITMGKAWAVIICTDLDDKDNQIFKFSVGSKNAADGLLARLHQHYPMAAYGFNEQIQKEYYQDPKAFHNKVRFILSSRQQQ